MLPATIGWQPGIAFVFEGTDAAENAFHRLGKVALSTKHPIEASIAGAIGADEKQIIRPRVDQGTLRGHPPLQQTRRCEARLVPRTIRVRDFFAKIAQFPERSARTIQTRLRHASIGRRRLWLPAGTQGIEFVDYFDPRLSLLLLRAIRLAAFIADTLHRRFMGDVDALG